MIAAIVVLYYPEERALTLLLSSLEGQVDAVLAIDNTPGSLAKTPPVFESFGKLVSYIALGKNLGIAAAQNIGIKRCIQDGISHIILLDQDSVLSPNCVPVLLDAEARLVAAGEPIAALCPQVFDERTGLRPAAVRYKLFFVRKIWSTKSSSEPIATDNLIASGSLFRSEVLRKVGLMLEELFIEYVDTEWAFRARSFGYRSYCIPGAVIHHNMGDRSVRLLGKNIFLYGAIRYQYKLRNAAFLLKRKTMGWNWRSYVSIIIPFHLIVFTALSKNRRSAFASLLQAVRNGWNAKLGEIVPE